MLPSQPGVSTSLVYPCKQAHLNEPSVFTHFPGAQTLLLLHSSTSMYEESKQDMDEPWKTYIIKTPIYGSFPNKYHICNCASKQSRVSRGKLEDGDNPSLFLTVDKVYYRFKPLIARLSYPKFFLRQWAPLMLESSSPP